jgi:LacI family kdg operon repressor
MRRQGIELSGELGLCGFDDWAWSELIGPGITTLVADTYEMGVRSAELLLERIRGKEPGPARCIELKNVLTERGSTQIQ